MTDHNHEEIVRESFRRQAGEFSRSHSIYAHREGPFAWKDELNEEMIALEVACGAGHASEAIAPLVREVIGIDLTVELLQIGANRLREKGITNVLLQEANAQALPFVTSSFDLSFCRSSLHHFSHPLVAIDEMKRVTKPGGHLMVNDLIVPSGVDQRVFDQIHRLLDPSHVATFSQAELKGVLAAEASVTSVEAETMRFPIEVAFNELSEKEGVIAALQSEIDGGQKTGFEPENDGDSYIVSFLICEVHARNPMN